MNVTTDSLKIASYINNLNLSHIFDKELIDILAIHSFDVNEVLFNEDDTVKYLYVLVSGRTGVIPSSEEGKLSLLDIIIPGDIIGDMEYLNNDRYYYQVIALTNCYLLAIPTNMIDQYFQSNIYFYKYISENLAQKMKRTSHKYSRALLYPLKNRLSKYLLDLMSVHGIDIPEVQTKYTAEYFGISPRHLRRVLLDMEQDGILSRESSLVHILDEEKLKGLASYK